MKGDLKMRNKWKYIKPFQKIRNIKVNIETSKIELEEGQRIFLGFRDSEIDIYIDREKEKHIETIYDPKFIRTVKSYNDNGEKYFLLINKVSPEKDGQVQIGIDLYLVGRNNVKKYSEIEIFVPEYLDEPKYKKEGFVRNNLIYHGECIFAQQKEDGYIIIGANGDFVNCNIKDNGKIIINGVRKTKKKQKIEKIIKKSKGILKLFSIGKKFPLTIAEDSKIDELNNLEDESANANQHQYYKKWENYLKIENEIINLIKEEIEPIEFIGTKYLTEETVELKFEPSKKNKEKIENYEKYHNSVGLSIGYGDDNKLIGDLKKIRHESIIVELAKKFDFQLPSCGEFKTNTVGTEKQIENKEKAMTEVLGEYGRIKDLERLLTGDYGGKKLGKKPAFKREKKWMINGLPPTKSQEEAIRKAINTPDICVIQGPPGTGKTTLIKTIIKRIKQINSETNVIVSSYQHLAVDNIMDEDLMEFVNIPYRFDTRGTDDSEIIKRTLLKGWKDKTYKKMSGELNKEKPITSKSFSRIVNDIYKSKDIEEQIDLLQNQIIPIFESDFKIKEKNEIERLLKALPTIKNANEKIKEWCENNSSNSEVENGNTINSIVTEWERDYLNDNGNDESLWQSFQNHFDLLGVSCGQAGRRDIADNIDPGTVVIIDEAARASLLDILIPIVKGGKAILVGDHKQLPFFIQNVLKEKGIKQEEYDYFQNLFNSKELNEKEKVEVLDQQFRMHPKIGDVVSKVFYDGKIKNHPCTEKMINESSLFTGESFVWMDTDNSKTNNNENGRFTNKAELEDIRKCIIRFRDNKKEYSVGIISYYKQQVNRINEIVKEEGFENFIEVGTVDSYQGKEYDIIILSPVRNNSDENYGFVGDSPERINVSISRGRRLLVIVGSKSFWSGNKYFKEIIEYAEIH